PLSCDTFALHDALPICIVGIIERARQDMALDFAEAEARAEIRQAVVHGERGRGEDPGARISADGAGKGLGNVERRAVPDPADVADRKGTRLNASHVSVS